MPKRGVAVSEEAIWIAHYVYEDTEGVVRTMTTQIGASSRGAAQDIAANAAPAKDFILTIHAQSSDQVLGTVRTEATKHFSPTSFNPNDYTAPDDDG